MHAFITLKEHYDYLDTLLKKKPRAVLIASFGIYAGITHEGVDWETKYPTLTRRFLESLKSINEVMLLIGVGDYKSCKGKNVICKDCERAYVNQLIRLLNHRDLFPNFKWKVSLQAHAKCTLCISDHDILGVAGGRNLNDSSAIDVTFPIDSAVSAQLLKHIMPIWKKAMPLSEDSLDKILAIQNISHATSDAMISKPF